MNDLDRKRNERVRDQVHVAVDRERVKSLESWAKGKAALAQYDALVELLATCDRWGYLVKLQYDAPRRRYLGVLYVEGAPAHPVSAPTFPTMLDMLNGWLEAHHG